MAVAETSTSERRPPATVWLAAVAEIGVAVAVALIVFRAGRSPSEHVAMDDGTAGMHMPTTLDIRWDAASLALAAGTAALLVWWLVERTWILAVTTVIGLVCLCMSQPVRESALHSHLIGMAVLEVLLVGVPLLLLSGWTPLTGRGRPISSTAWVVCVAVLYSLLLVTLHLPSIHDRGASMDLLPWWLPMLVVITGIGYWTAILTTAGSVRLAVRRGALVIAQEVAFVLGLAALIAPSPAMQHTNLLGLSPTMDHRMGGLLMIVTCAAVALPLLKRLDARRESPETRTEHNVH